MEIDQVYSNMAARIQDIFHHHHVARVCSIITPMAAPDGKHVCMLMQPPACSAVPPTAGSHSYRMWVEQAPCGRVPHPRGAARAARAAHALATAAALLHLPFQVFLHCPNPYDPFILFGDFMSFLNILATFATGYVDDENKLIVLEPKLIARHYLRTNFIPDLIGSLPLQLIPMFDDCRYPSHTIMLIVKLFRLPTFIVASRDLLEQMGLSYGKKKVTTVILKLLLFFHWMTFIHYQVPCFTIHYYSEDAQYMVWVKRFFMVDLEKGSIFQTYTANLYLVCGLCIGAGYYSPVDQHLISELLLTTSMSLIGMIFLTYAFSTLLKLAIYWQYEMNLFNGRFRELKEYMNINRLPKYLQRKINLFINYKYNGHYFNEEVIMSTINEQIKQDINMYGCKTMVMAVPLFQNMPIALINAIIFNLTQVLYMPGELLVKYGQPGVSLYMISSGTVAVMSSSGRELAHLRDGAHFGAGALLRPGAARPATVIALEITEIYKLDSQEFQSCLQPYPHLKRRLEETYHKRQTPDTTPGNYQAV